MCNIYCRGELFCDEKDGREKKYFERDLSQLGAFIFLSFDSLVQEQTLTGDEIEENGCPAKSIGSKELKTI